MTATIPDPKFDHLLHLTDHRGTFEHACYAEPRPRHGYCTDDMARVLVVATREPNSDGEVNRLAGVAVRFLNDAQSYAGTCRNRMDRKGRWEDEPSLKDCWGRCIWGLGTAAAHSDVSLVRRLAVIQFERAAKVRSPWPRAMAFAALGAAELLSVDPGQRAARELLTDYAYTVAKPNGHSAWPWPEKRLTYANAVLPEAMIAAGVALDDSSLRQQGLDLLGTNRQETTFRPLLLGAVGRTTFGPRSISSRSRCPPWPTRARGPRPLTLVRSGPTGSWPQRPGSWVSTMRDSPCGTPTTAADSTACTPMG